VEETSNKTSQNTIHKRK